MSLFAMYALLLHQHPLTLGDISRTLLGAYYRVLLNIQTYEKQKNER